MPLPTFSKLSLFCQQPLRFQIEVATPTQSPTFARTSLIQHFASRSKLIRISTRTLKQPDIAGCHPAVRN
jgi:hypothetical protein